MNQRMLELVEESRDWVPTQTKVAGHVYVPGPMVRGDVNLQRFTELIVAECEEVVRWAISVDSTIEKVPVLIREHFGVES